MLIRKPTMADRAEWDRLYEGYAAFYKVTQTPEMRDRVWGWIHDAAHPVEALVADAGGHLVGLAHFRAFSRPLSASTGGFLDDLFVDPAARGAGAVNALLGELRRTARDRGWTVLRWITAENNYRARAVYDRQATRTVWLTYDMPPAGAE